MSGHTKGPWTIGCDNVIYDEKNRDPICDASFRSDEVSSANASLIAAAPDLLEALEALVSVLDPYDYPDEQGPARAAIAKARGEK